MKVLVKGLLGAVALAGFSLPAYAETTLTIATVNNGNMIDMQRLTDDFTKANPDIKLNWVTLEENVLRQKVTTDIATHGGQFDVLTIGTYETFRSGPRRSGCCRSTSSAPTTMLNDLLPAIRAGLSLDGKLYAAPFYGESSFVMYRTDLMEKAGLKMPEKPTWDFIRQAADKMTDKAAGVYGICLRGKPGWGENMAFLTAMPIRSARVGSTRSGSHSSTRRSGRRRSTIYVPLMKADGPPGASSNGFNENFGAVQRRQVRYVDRRHCRRRVDDCAKDSKVADKVGYALAPDNGLGKRGNWLWSWSLASQLAQRRRTRRRSSFRGRPTNITLDLVASKLRLGERSAWHAHIALQECRLHEGRAVCRSDAGIDQLGRPAASDGEAGALYGRAVRGDPRVPGHRHRRRAGLLGRSRGIDDRRPSAREGASQRDDRDEEGRLHQVS